MGNTWAYSERYGWVQILPGGSLAGTSIVLHNVHSGRDCRYRHCTIHNPTAHGMEEWQLIYRADRNIFERLCPEHRVGHPDPDQFEYWEETDQLYQGTHGCCGCCQETLTWAMDVTD